MKLALMSLATDKGIRKCLTTRQNFNLPLISVFATANVILLSFELTENEIFKSANEFNSAFHEYLDIDKFSGGSAIK